MNWRRFNTNESVRVKLTDVGLAEFRRQREAINRHLPASVPPLSMEPKLDEEGYYTDTLWGLMADFGHLMSLGRTPPFETEILLPADLLREP